MIMKFSVSTWQPDMKAKSLIALAGWDYSGSRSKPGYESKRGESIDSKLSNIPCAKTEVLDIEEGWKRHLKGTTKSDLNVNAQRVLDFVKKIRKPTVVHLAAHGSMSELGPPILWLPGGKNSNYSPLHFESFFRVDWSKCDFLFLNCCLGAFGIERVGGPLMGFQEALVTAGVKNFLGPY